MSTTKTTTALPDATPIKEALTSPAAIKQLEARGFNTIGDLRAASEPTDPSAPVAPSPVVESDEPIQLRSKWDGYVLRLVPGDVVTQAFGRPRVLVPVALEFRNGEAEMSRENWLNVKHQRDAQKIMAELLRPSSEAPWRKDALMWLKMRVGFRRNDFAVME